MIPGHEPDLQRMARQIDGPVPDGASFLARLDDNELSLFAEAVALQRLTEGEQEVVATLVHLRRHCDRAGISYVACDREAAERYANEVQGKKAGSR